MRKITPPIVLLTGAVCCTSSLYGETVYVRDTLYVPIRGGQSTEHRILHKGVRSGTKLEKLEQNTDTGYSLVRMKSGLEGWIQTQYLVDRPIAEEELERTAQQLLALEEQHQKALLRLQETQATQAQLAQSKEDLRAENEELAGELKRITDLAASTMAIDEQNQQLVSEKESLLSTISVLDTQNQDLQDDSNQDWFLRGAGTVLIGLLFGFWVARRIYQKRDTGGWA